MRPFSLTPVLAGLALVIAGCLDDGASPDGPDPQGPPGLVAGPVPVVWGAPVDLETVGYEPSLAADSTGALFITAHKDLGRPDTWPYLASPLLVSRDRGLTWEAPQAPADAHQAFVAGEGDLATDGRDWLYYVDTYLADNHLHVWSEQGRSWQYSVPQRTVGGDDRPWVFAQGQGVLHYLGNNAVPAAGLRVAYYRSTDGGLTISPGTGLPGAGWAHGAAQTRGALAYVIQEALFDDATDLWAMASSDEGATWGEPVVAGRRDGLPGDGSPRIAVDEAGTPTAVWVDAQGGPEAGTRLFASQSHDQGATWTPVEITPFAAYMDHVTVGGGADGVVAVAFYGTPDLPLSPTSEWFLYAGLSRGPITGPGSFTFTKADPQVLYTGDDTHALHDFFEIVVDDEGALCIAYMTAHPGDALTLFGPTEDRRVWFVRGPAASSPVTA